MPLVDVVCGTLLAAPAQVAAAAGLLSAAERERAARFRFDRDRRRFIVRRARLREVLGAATGADPRDLAFTANRFGKPELVGSALRFSASHSGERWLVATAAQEIGVDCERIDAQTDWNAVARSLFGPSEIAAIAAQPGRAGQRAFFDCWARKEAFVKALGIGLSYPLDAFAVSVAGGAELLAGGEGWTIAALPLGPGYAGALVSADTGSPLEVRFHCDEAALAA